MLAGSILNSRPVCTKCTRAAFHRILSTKSIHDDCLRTLVRRHHGVHLCDLHNDIYLCVPQLPLYIPSLPLERALEFTKYGVLVAPNIMNRMVNKWVGNGWEETILLLLISSLQNKISFYCQVRINIQIHA